MYVIMIIGNTEYRCSVHDAYEMAESIARDYDLYEVFVNADSEQTAIRIAFDARGLDYRFS
jgi:hypothetical protein